MALSYTHKTSLIFSLIMCITAPSIAQTHQAFKGIHQIHLEEFGKEVPSIPDSVSPAEVVPLAERETAPSRYVVGYHPYWNNGLQTAYKWDLLTVVNYFNVQLGNDGSITDNNGWPFTALINAAHNNGVRVQLVATNFSASGLSTLLGSASNRTRAVNNLVGLIVSGNGDGIDIDFEGVPQNRRGQLVLFMGELRDSLDAVDSSYTVSMASPAVDWSDAWDYDALADICDWLFIMGYNYHWSGGPTAGPVSPIDAVSGWQVTRSVNDYLTKTGNDTNKIVLGLPYYGIKWPTVSSVGFSNTRGNGTSIFYNAAKSEVIGFGRIWHSFSKSPWYVYNSNGWFVTWYDDEESISHKYALAAGKGLKGVGMWALGYDDGFNELWLTLYNHFGTTEPPKPPIRLRVETDAAAGEIVTSLYPDSGATSFDFFLSTDGDSYRFLGNSISPRLSYSNVSLDSVYYVKVRARNRFGVSPETEILAVLAGLNSEVLVVNGFDRDEGVTPSNTRDYIRQYAESIKAAGYSFDSASNEAVEKAAINLRDYDVTIWIAGSESAADETLTPVEQARIKSLLESGGKLFISGSNIGFDLVENGSVSDSIFYSDYLKALFVNDDVGGVEQVQGIIPDDLAGAFTGIDTLTLDDGSFGTYKVESPDGILPQVSTGAALNLNYEGFEPETAGGAGIEYTGTFGSSSEDGAVIYLSFPFETIVQGELRDSLMKRVFDYFERVPVGIEDRHGAGIPSEFILSQNFPNPFNPNTSIGFHLPSSGRAGLTIYDIRGRRVTRLLNGELKKGFHTVNWNGLDERGRAVASGIYFYVLDSKGVIARKKMVLIR